MRARSFVRTILGLSFLAMITLQEPLPVLAEHVLELPILATVKSNNLGVFEILLLQWDQKPAPIPPALQWQIGNVMLGGASLSSMSAAFHYAIQHTPSITHSGTVTAVGIAYMSIGSDGPSAGAAMAVGFIAMFRGDTIQRGIALTGTLQSDGTVGPVGGLSDKVRAAAREGYRKVLIPGGQLLDPRWDLNRLGLEMNVELKEVSTIEEAYRLMTGRTF